MHPLSSTSLNVLLVEGINDKHVVLNLCQRCQINQNFTILDRDGIDQLIETVGAELNAPDRQTVGILVDANDDWEARWQSITSRLSHAGINAPQKPDPKGTIIDMPGKPRVGVWLMPDNRSNGELEDFICYMLPDNDPVWPLSKRYIKDIPSTERKFNRNKALRAKLYAWLATRENPKQMGSAISAHDLSIDGNRCQKFMRWLMELFGQESVCANNHINSH